MTRMYRKLPYQGGQPREVAEIVNNLVEGKSNNTGTVDLATGGATTTTINDERIGFDSIILLAPLSLASASTGQQVPHGFFEDDANQSFTANTATVIALTESEIAYGVSLSSNQVTVDYAGLYEASVQCRFENDQSQIHNAYVWFRKNGTDLAHTCQSITIPDKQGSVNGASHVSLNHPLDLSASDYVEVVCAVDDANVVMTAEASQTTPYVRPSIPSVEFELYMVAPSQTSGSGLQPYISARQKGSATITHLPNSVSNNTWGYVIIG